MAIEIGNLSASLCSVDASAPAARQGNVPKFFGPGGREFANVGFGAFAPTPAPLVNSERIVKGVYRMHLVQSFTFSGGQVGVLCTLNANRDEATKMDPFPPGINAIGVDFGSSGCDVLVTVGGGPSNGSGSPIDGDFTLFVLQYPIQHTP